MYGSNPWFVYLFVKVRMPVFLWQSLFYNVFLMLFFVEVDSSLCAVPYLNHYINLCNSWSIINSYNINSAKMNLFMVFLQESICIWDYCDFLRVWKWLYIELSFELDNLLGFALSLWDLFDADGEFAILVFEVLLLFFFGHKEYGRDILILALEFSFLCRRQTLNIIAQIKLRLIIIIIALEILSRIFWARTINNLLRLSQLRGLSICEKLVTFRFIEFEQSIDFHRLAVWS